jgi:hypothetical protein
MAGRGTWRAATGAADGAGVLAVGPEACGVLTGATKCSTNPLAEVTAMYRGGVATTGVAVTVNRREELTTLATMGALVTVEGNPEDVGIKAGGPRATQPVGSAKQYSRYSSLSSSGVGTRSLDLASIWNNSCLAF